MEINANTRISAIIQENKAAIDAIAAVAKPLSRLKNPILRKVMASRVSLAEAAKMGGTTVDALVAALLPLGFVFKHAETATEPVHERPIWLKNSPESLRISFDVRPIIEKGTDPLKEILHRFKEVPEGHILVLINSFVPTPLIHLLEKDKAEATYVESISAGEFHTYFLKRKRASETAGSEEAGATVKKDKTTSAEIPGGAATTGEDGAVVIDDETAFAAVKDHFDSAHIREIDVRALEMPGPMQAILTELETLDDKEMLYIHHKRVPVYLLEELADKQFEIHIHTVDDINVKMIIFKRNSSV